MCQQHLTDEEVLALDLQIEGLEQKAAGLEAERRGVLLQLAATKKRRGVSSPPQSVRAGIRLERT